MQQICIDLDSKCKNCKSVYTRILYMCRSLPHFNIKGFCPLQSWSLFHKGLRLLNFLYISSMILLSLFSLFCCSVFMSTLLLSLAILLLEAYIDV